jgi:hypothetical protein
LPVWSYEDRLGGKSDVSLCLQGADLPLRHVCVVLPSSHIDTSDYILRVITFYDLESVPLFHSPLLLHFNIHFRT